MGIILALAITTNAFLIGLSFSGIPLFVGEGWLGRAFNTIILCLVGERVAFLCKGLLEAAIGAEPRNIRVQRARQAFFEAANRDALTDRPHFDFKLDDGWQDFNYKETFENTKLIQPEPLHLSFTRSASGGDTAQISEKRAGAMTIRIY